jgi:hypothetical protein
MRPLLEHCTTTVTFLFLFGAKVHFANDFGKHLVNVGLVLGARLDKRTTPLLRQRVALAGLHLPLVVQVDFVGHEEDGDSLGALHPGDELLHRPNILERLVVSQTVDHHEPLSVLDVKVAHAGELFRPCRVQYFQNTRGIVHFDLFAVEILDGWVVFFHETSGNKLNRQCTFPNPTRSENHNFKLTHSYKFAIN